jgi:acyl-CoA thioesterase
MFGADINNPSAIAMYETDAAIHHLGIEIVSVDEGSATVAMTVTDTMVNGYAVCHGGLVFTLADTAMAYASNSLGSRALAASASIEFLRPAYAEERIIATATSPHVGQRTSYWDVAVTNPNGDTVAIFRGRTKVFDG